MTLWAPAQGSPARRLTALRTRVRLMTAMKKTGSKTGFGLLRLQVDGFTLCV